jgi:hypothetical protein
MTMFVEANGLRVIDGRVAIPYVGPWTADVTLDVEKALSGSVALVLAGLALTCAPWRPVVPYGGRTTARLVGGRGMLGKTLPAKPYRSPAGVRLSTVLADVARETGETIVVEATADRVLGSHFVREEAIASRLLNSIGGLWYVDTNGTIRVATARAPTAITSPFEVTAFDSARRAFVVATEKPGDWIPGRTFSSPRVPGTFTISGVSHVVSKSAFRTEVLAR